MSLIEAQNVEPGMVLIMEPTVRISSEGDSQASWQDLRSNLTHLVNKVSTHNDQVFITTWDSDQNGYLWGLHPTAPIVPVWCGNNNDEECVPVKYDTFKEWTESLSQTKELREAEELVWEARQALHEIEKRHFSATIKQSSRNTSKQ